MNFTPSFISFHKFHFMSFRFTNVSFIDSFYDFISFAVPFIKSWKLPKSSVSAIVASFQLDINSSACTN